MHNLTYENGIQSLYGLYDFLLDEGTITSPRDQETMEARNVTITIKNPADTQLDGIGRKFNQKLAILETLQLIGGFSDPVLMKEAAPNTANFLNGGMFNGSYGPRIAAQMPFIIDKLIHERSTRQAIAMVWDPMRDLVLEENKDRPCTVYFAWHIRDGALVQTTHMRSNDLWWGWCYDLTMFTQLQHSVANAVGIPVGEYVHYVDSFHMYTKNVKDLEKLELRESRYITKRSTELFGVGDPRYHLPWGCFAETARQIVYDDFEYDHGTATEQFMYDVLHGGKK
jgi:thymidylate synthase